MDQGHIRLVEPLARDIRTSAWDGGSSPPAGAN
jgi:hypothetical protein